MLHFKFKSDPATWGVGGETEILENAYSGEIEMKFDGKNNHKF